MENETRKETRLSHPTKRRLSGAPGALLDLMQGLFGGTKPKVQCRQSLSLAGRRCFGSWDLFNVWAGGSTPSLCMHLCSSGRDCCLATYRQSPSKICNIIASEKSGTILLVAVRRPQALRS